jgi:hypothetical protein
MVCTCNEGRETRNEFRILVGRPLVKSPLGTHETELHGLVVNIPAPYSGRPGLKSRPGDRLS